jgi:Ala-tRNA(Pro) deacylase
MRVAAFLEQNHVECETLLHPPAYTAQKRARFLHVPGRQVAKSVLLRTSSGYLVAVLPATHQIDTEALGVALGERVQVAPADEVAGIFPDCEWGTVPAFGTLYGLPTLLDDGIDADRVLVFEGHTHGLAWRMRCRDYERFEHPRRLAFARLPSLPPPATSR